MDDERDESDSSHLPVSLLQSDTRKAVVFPHFCQ